MSMIQKPNFNQTALVQAQEREIRHLQGALKQQQQLTGLIEACASGFCSQLKDPGEIARLVLETSGAIAFAPNDMAETPDQQ